MSEHPSQKGEAHKILETVSAERCPCGHLKQRHRKPDAESVWPEVMGACRDCDCRGLIDFDAEAAEDER